MVEFDTVFVSPLLRAVETAYYMFEDHPNFENIQFVIHPDLRENIMTAGDIPGSILETVEKFSGKFPNLCMRLFPRTYDGQLDELFYTRDFSPELMEKVEGLNKYETDLVL